MVVILVAKYENLYQFNFCRYFVKNLNKLNFEKNENYYYLIDKNVYKKILKKKLVEKFLF